MIIFISVLLILAGFILKRSKGLYMLQFSWMWIVLSFCSNSMRVDYQNYLWAYEGFGTGTRQVTSSEWGYALLNKWFYQMGLPFEYVNSLFVLFTLIIFAIVIPKYVKNYNIPASFFMLFPLLLNGIQIRNALSSAIIVWGIQYLFSDKKVDLIKYCITVGIAMLFHVTAFFYLIFLLVKFCSLKNLQIITAFLILSILSIFDLLEPILVILMGEDRFESKLIGRNSWLECIPAVIWGLMLLLTVMFMYLQFKNQIIDEFHRKFIDLMVKIDTLLLVLLPIMVIDYSFERMSRNIIILNYCFFCFYYEYFYAQRSKTYYLNLAFSCLYIFYSILCFEIVLGNRFENVVKIYMDQNYILSMPKDYAFILFIIFYAAGMGFLFDRKNIVWKKK